MKKPSSKAPSTRRGTTTSLFALALSALLGCAPSVAPPATSTAFWQRTPPPADFDLIGI
jgi:hypothetical protein